MKQKLTLFIFVALCFLSANDSFCQTIKINSISDLKKIGVDTSFPLNGIYSLESDLNFSAEPVVDGSNFIPIANEGAFRGEFNGNNHIISGLKIIKTSDNAGLFSFTNGGKILNLTIKDSQIESKANNAGAIAAEMSKSSIVNCHNINTTVKSATRSGGIAGVMSSKSSIDKSSNSGAITATTSSFGEAGGICGRIHPALGTDPDIDMITNSFNTGNVTGNCSIMGGIIGTTPSNATITDCYNTGKVQGYQVIGGIAGNSAGSIGRCYNVGEISCLTIYNGAISGRGVESLIKNCYYDKKILTTSMTGAIGTEAVSSGIDNAANNVIKLTTAEMNSRSKYSSWANFDTNWKLCSARNYPYLAWENYSCTGTNINNVASESSPIATINNNVLIVNSDVQTIQVYAINGVKLIETSQQTVSLLSLNKGTYIIKIIDNSKKVSTLKFIKTL